IIDSIIDSKNIIKENKTIVNQQLIIDEPIFTKVEKEPTFSGGQKKLIQFLKENVNGALPAKKGAPNGNYNVVVQFIVNKDGELSQFKSVTSLGYGMEEEVIRVLKLSPNWIPANQNGRNVNAYTRSVVTFIVPKEINNTSAIDQPLKYPHIRLSALQSMNNLDIAEIKIDGYAIKSFSIYANDKKAGLVVHVNEGPVFDEKTKAIITAAQAGDIITIEKIIGVKNGEVKKFPSRLFMIE
ncbi:MAG TPA: energy transducer TonB, partial [Chitinophagaceae bacterium]|nr:energy transducer TonB [Chitinophagaceae bacterium]